MMRNVFKLNGFGSVVYYNNYEDLEARIQAFPLGYDVLGKDASGVYDIYGIGVGNPSNPSILIHSAIHGNEWQGVDFSLTFMESLANRTFPDKRFLNNVLAKYHIYCIPCANPWGYVQTTPGNEWPEGLNNTISRLNANGKNCNRDWNNEPAEPEQEIVKSKFRELKPFGFLNIHLKPNSLRPDAEVEYMSGSPKTQIMHENISKIHKMNLGHSYGFLTYGTSDWQGRAWGAAQEANHGGEIISFITEIKADSYFSNQAYMEIGLTQIYLFMQNCIRYFTKRVQR